MFFETRFDFLYHLPPMCPLIIQPENGRPSSNPGACNSQFDPVPDRIILDRSHAPNITFFHIVFVDCLSFSINDTHDPISRSFKSGRVRTILFRLFGHQSYILYCPHCRRIQGSMGYTIFESGCIKWSVG